MRAGVSALASTFVLVAARAATAQVVDAPPESPAEDDLPISGVEVPGRDSEDALRTFGEVLLFVPRQIVEFLYLGTNAAIAVIENEPVVPRVQQLVSTPGGRLYVLPTLFADTNADFNVGARLIADQGDVASGLRVGFGGLNSFEMEPRLAWRISRPIRAVLSAESLYRRDNDDVLLGLGGDPSTDPRNRFQEGKRGAEAAYFEERTRYNLSIAVRPSDLFEVLLAGSWDRRQTEDARATDEDLLSETFEPGSVVGAFERYAILYGEAAVRFDTRPTRGKPSGGVLAEAYAGTARSVEGVPAEFVRYGGRLAGFIPVYRDANIIAIRGIVDGVATVSASPLPFQEYNREPDFRGVDDRRDALSIVTSLDYRWLVLSPFAMSIFGDVALLAPAWDAVDFGDTRWALGLAADIHADDAQIGHLGFAAGPEGARLLLSLGVATGYGDRIHRK